MLFATTVTLPVFFMLVDTIFALIFSSSFSFLDEYVFPYPSGMLDTR